MVPNEFGLPKDQKLIEIANLNQKREVSIRLLVPQELKNR